MITVRPPSVDYGTLDVARARLLATFGYPDFRPPQIRAVQAVLSGRDSLVVLPTGGGKSLCYQVPALIRDGLTVVISPLISLMKDQVDALERKGVSAAFINSTLSVREAGDRMARASEGSLKMLYLAPERLEAGRTLQQLVAIGVSLLAVDEAHCISEWGHDFRPSYRRIGSLRERLGSPQTVALTATATPDVRLDIVRQLALRDAEVVVAGFDRINLTYHVTPVRSQAEKDTSAIGLLRATDAPAIVYAPTRKAVERVTAVLVRGRIRAVAYHAGLDDALRQRAQDAFMQQRARVIVATSAFGMGIDKPDVRLVVHHSMPGTLEAYYQEAGRAGRDGKPSTCVLLHAYPDRFTHEFFIDGAHPDRATVEQTWTFLRAHANRDGVVAQGADVIAHQLASALGDRKVSAALRVLVAAGVCRLEAASMGRVSVRLLATPERIAAELSGARAVDRDVLRAFWKVAGRTLEDGAVIDLTRLPRHLGGLMALVPVLERLAAQQFVTWRRMGTGVRLDPRARHPKWLPVDWSALDRRRRADLRRLDAMQRYAQTRYCRRAFVLRYFGDPEVRSRCVACDRCLGTTEVLPPASTKQSVRGRTRPL
jgi:ATP-dependent DNA helicase RecQ